jgi:hypothetical protein
MQFLLIRQVNQTSHRYKRTTCNWRKHSDVYVFRPSLSKYQIYEHVTTLCHFKDRMFTLIPNEHRRIDFERERLVVAKILKMFPFSYRLKLYAFYWISSACCVSWSFHMSWYMWSTNIITQPSWSVVSHVLILGNISVLSSKTVIS